jgi:hypothetical protein
MKKIPFYNPASPLFFHIAVAVLYILIFLRLLSLSIFFPISFTILIFTAAYPFFALVMVILVRRVYNNTHQIPVPQEFANKLVLHNRLLISVIYILSLTNGWFIVAELPFFDGGALFLIPLFISGLCFLFHLYILPKLIRFILLKKGSIKSDVIISGVLFALFLIIILNFIFFNFWLDFLINRK